MFSFIRRAAADAAATVVGAFVCVFCIVGLNVVYIAVIFVVVVVVVVTSPLHFSLLYPIKREDRTLHRPTTTCTERTQCMYSTVGTAAVH